MGNPAKVKNQNKKGAGAKTNERIRFGERLVLCHSQELVLAGWSESRKLRVTRRCLMLKKYVVRLTDQERDELQAVVKKLKGTGQKVRRAQILLKADVAGPNWTDQRIADAVGCRTKTLENVRQRLVERGFEETLNGARRAQPAVAKLLDGNQEARIITTRLGPPPAGYANWTLRLLARKVVELEIVETVSYETVRRTLKKWHDEPQDRVLGDSPGVRRRIRGEHGRCAGNVRETVRSGLTGAVHG